MLHDGPLLEQSPKACAGTWVRPPRGKQFGPDRDRLAARSSSSGVLPRYRGPGRPAEWGEVWPEMTKTERAVWIAYGRVHEGALARLGLCVARIPEAAGSICDRLRRLPCRKPRVEPETAGSPRSMLQPCRMERFGAVGNRWKCWVLVATMLQARLG
jgi:hypothetical protein